MIERPETTMELRFWTFEQITDTPLALKGWFAESLTYVKISPLCTYIYIYVCVCECVSIRMCCRRVSWWSTSFACLWLLVVHAQVRLVVQTWNPVSYYKNRHIRAHQVNLVSPRCCGIGLVTQTNCFYNLRMMLLAFIALKRFWKIGVALRFWRSVHASFFEFLSCMYRGGFSWNTLLIGFFWGGWWNACCCKQAVEKPLDLKWPNLFHILFWRSSPRWLR